MTLSRARFIPSAASPTAKLDNLLAKAPGHCHGELKRDYRLIIYATNREKAESAYGAFCRKWKKLVPSVVKSLDEGGDKLLTCL